MILGAVAALVLVTLTAALVLIPRNRDNPNLVENGNNSQPAVGDLSNDGLVDNNQPINAVDPFEQFTTDNPERNEERIVDVPDQPQPPSGESYPLLAPGEFVSPAPFERVVSNEAPSSPLELRDLINESLQAAWEANGLKPTNRVSDEAWLVRVSTRLLGDQPSPTEMQELRELLDDSGRQALVSHLMNHDQYRDRFEQRLSRGLALQLLGFHRDVPIENDPNFDQFNNYLASLIENKTPWDSIAYGLISATGGIETESENYNPATSYWKLISLRTATDQSQWANHVSQTFLNQNMQCAQCHNSSDQQVAQLDHWRLRAFLAQSQIGRDANGEIRLENVDFLPEREKSLDQAALQVADSDQFAFPALPGEDPDSLSGLVKQFDRRTVLAGKIAVSQEWKTALVNHVWTLYLNSPLESHDRNTAAPLSDLQDKLAEQIAADDYQIESLIAAILISEPFALAVENQHEAARDNPMFGTAAYFTRYYDHQISLRRSEDALAIVDKTYRETENQDLIAMRGVLAQRINGAVQTPEAIKVTQGLPQKQIGWGQDLTNSAILQSIVDSEMSRDDKIKHLVISAFKRLPTDEEMQACQSILDNSSDDLAAYQDIWWALFNSFEFTLPGGIK